ncbi:MAG: tyrosine-type recombinase/integrase [Verrucomicrobiota bacterium]|nr:tyrosine-type recombinase/integrase [Verrucomicrobiota bacterium]
MKHHHSFVITQFTNPSGKVVFRISGWLDGKRIRKNFGTRAEAEAERQVLEVHRLQGETGVRPTVTRLTEDQLHEAEAVVRRLAGKPHSLSFYVDFALANYREPMTQKFLTEAVADYVATKEHEYEQDLLSEPHLTRLKRDLTRLQKHFPGATVAELTAPRLIEYFEARHAALKTFNNRRGVVSTFLKFALQRDWIAENPLIKIPPRRIRRRRSGAATLTAEQAKRLMAYIEENHPSAVPFFTLCLFAGIRPCLRTGEILRLKPEHIKLTEGVIRIDSDVSKVREPRTVTIQPNLAAWLRAYPLGKFPIIAPNLQHIREKAVEKFHLSHDIMRHTFISMFVGKFRSMGEAALQAGNSESIIRKHYLDLKSAAEAEEFFSIVPKRADASARNATFPPLRLAV